MVIVRSKLEYGTASNTNLRQLDSIHEGILPKGPCPLEERRLKLHRLMPNWSAPWGHPAFHQERTIAMPKDTTSL